MTWSWLSRRVSEDIIIIEQPPPYDEIWERLNDVYAWNRLSEESRSLLREAYRRVSTLCPNRQKDWFVLAHLLAMALACGEEE